MTDKPWSLSTHTSIYWFTKCSPDVLGNIENEVRVSSAIVKYRDFIGILIKAKIMGLLTPGMVNLTAKYHINVCP